MPALNYQQWKAEKVKSGECVQTIRAQRKRPFQVGDRLYHYTGMRTKECRKLLENECLQALDIMIDGVCVVIDHGIPLDADQREMLAQADGFASYDDMEAWFGESHGFPFNGQLILWEFTSEGGVKCLS